MLYSADECIIKDQWNSIYERGYKTEIDEDIPGVVELFKKYRVKKSIRFRMRFRKTHNILSRTRI